MEQDIRDWQKLWEAKRSSPLDVDKLIKKINTLEKKGKRERIALFIATPLTLIILMSIIPTLPKTNYIAGVILIGAGMLMILIQLYRSKTQLIENEAELSNQEYTESMVGKLKLKMRTASRYMWIYTGLLIAGINLMYIPILGQTGFSFGIRLATHIGLSIAIALLMSVGISKRKTKHKNEILPLIEVLSNIVDR